MNIYGDKIFLRAIEKEDCELLLELINDPEIEIMLGGAIRGQYHTMRK